MNETLRIVVVAPDLAVADPDDDHAVLQAERSRALRIGLLENNFNLIATLPELPRLIHRRLLEPPAASDEAVRALGEAQRARNRWLAILAALLVLVVVELFVRRG